MADCVQVLDPNYRRIAGSVRSGRLYKGQGVIAATSSIPSKYQTVVTNNADQRGFGATSKRFNHDMTLNENPGPGSYVEQNKPILVKPSFSKKGMGVGFVSKEKRAKRHKTTPGPGPAYALPSMLTTKKDFNNATATSSFHTPIAVPRDKESSLPAPNHYKVSDSTMKRHYGSQVQASFKSTSRRVDYNKIQSVAPAPCHYTINETLTKEAPKVPMSSFKSTSNREFIPNNTRNPGPGHYHPHESVEEATKTLFPKKHYLCISAPAMPLPPPLPDPGPGSYELVNYKGPAKHYMSGSVFVSSSSRWNGETQNTDFPGPATYRPQTHNKKQSFLYNAQTKWALP
ncbi:O(6)-methylguanine-induced apoptosis 2 [Strongylocentrotus purpuratus]|uniref:O(6)-methylguanine-induced apoptosis 2 n=1 Tax=Strongylocentrotus purpuratus TaxID=7668 RepID=A0A7M7RFB5_STRPU|nr:O(6)-methylguanine-induced apoptosis 2 [Strongylocentrotus purpuratus]|eukprot:XP_797702.1 PREDICTED: O(6)-methylguanine-induced apoptosis 2 [Strongylocentrotus purpuratus]